MRSRAPASLRATSTAAAGAASPSAPTTPIPGTARRAGKRPTGAATRWRIRAAASSGRRRYRSRCASTICATFATEMLRRGVDVHRVQRLMRHSDSRVTTTTYGHLVVEDLRAAVDGQGLVAAPPDRPEPPPSGGGIRVRAPIQPHASALSLALESGAAANLADRGENSWWAQQDSNLRPLPCEGPRGGRQGEVTLGKRWQSRRTHPNSLLYGLSEFGTVWAESCCILAAGAQSQTTQCTRGVAVSRREHATRLPSVRARRTWSRASE